MEFLEHPEAYQNASVLWPIRFTRNEGVALRSLKFIARAYPMAAITFDRRQWSVRFYAFDAKMLQQICSFFDHACKVYEVERKETA